MTSKNKVQKHTSIRPALKEFRLAIALQRHIEEWSRRTNVRVDLYVGDDLETRRLERELATALYGMAQEALTNIGRHAQASRVSVLLESRPGYVSLIVEDNGRGFDAEAVLNAGPSFGGSGLSGMQEQASLAGGFFSIESRPGAGATIFVRLPLESASDKWE
jgi:two-component system sensor histidine kinase UhpB